VCWIAHLSVGRLFFFLFFFGKQERFRGVIFPFFLVQTRGFEMAAAESGDRQKKSQKSALNREFHIVSICCDFFSDNILG